MIPFQWASLSAAEQALLYPSDNATMGQNRLNYLRGDRTMEQSQAGGVFRDRDTALGDIVDSAPIYMGKPPFRYPTSLESVAYSTYVTSKASRTPVVYVGANDGMLHAFNASTNTDGTDTTSSGKEMFTFIPTAAQPNLYKLTSPNYSRRVLRGRDAVSRRCFLRQRLAHGAGIRHEQGRTRSLRPGRVEPGQHC